MHHCHSCSPAMIATIAALGKSDSIHNINITDLHGRLLFDSSLDPALLAGVDDIDDEDTSFAGIHNVDTSFAGVPVPNTTIMTNTDNNSDAESDHNSIDPNKVHNNSSKATIHRTRSHLSIHSATSEPPQHPLDEEVNLSKDQTELDDVELCKLKTQVPILRQSERVSVPPSDYIPWMGGKTYIMNVQPKPLKTKRMV